MLGIRPDQERERPQFRKRRSPLVAAVADAAKERAVGNQHHCFPFSPALLGGTLRLDHALPLSKIFTELR